MERNPEFACQVPRQSSPRLSPNIISRTTPRKRKAFEEVNGPTIKGLEIPLKQLKTSTKGKEALKEVARALVHRSQRCKASLLHMGRNTVANASRRFAAKRETKVDKAGIHDFYKREDIPRVMPQKRFAPDLFESCISNVPGRSS